MTIPPLLERLREQERRLYERLMDAREMIAKWLEYIPATFPSYTRHTIAHSDEIVSQVSSLLGEGTNTKSSTLSPMEIYTLGLAAYLHDAGMVTSDAEKHAILASTEWAKWLQSEPSAAERQRAIEELRENHELTSNNQRFFLADIQQRHLISDFVRRQHHSRARTLLYQDSRPFESAFLQDPSLKRTVAALCVGHGLSASELRDPQEYPTRRDILSSPVNVRFLAILLRLGDLLDMTAERACPMLLNAASPIPPESYVHWTQYQRIFHKVTSPQRIEITAECDTQEEHRQLSDWCQWIVEETQGAIGLMAATDQHSNWRPPAATVGEIGKGNTIEIKPSKSANYYPCSWRFELDPETVFQRLVRDIYRGNDTAFIRELIQNALDAVRCTRPPGQAIDNHEPSVSIELREENVSDETLGATRTIQLLSVNDYGMGMDEEVITQYFLQVGKSFYATESFRRSHNFIPSSRFGVGFLSVFAVSNHVTVDTFKPSSPNSKPLRLVLTGPRSYVLLERSPREHTGTKVQVRLRDPLAPGKLTSLVKDLCRKVEFPIAVNDLGTRSTITAETPADFIFKTPVVGQENEVFQLRHFPFSDGGIDGDIYILVHKGPRGEDWAMRRWAENGYLKSNPLATPLSIPESIVCVNGLSMGPTWASGTAVSRLDYRGRPVELDIGRTRLYDAMGYGSEVVNQKLAKLLVRHMRTTPLARSPDGWRYRQRLAHAFPLPRFWEYQPNTIRVWRENRPRLLSLARLQGAPMFATLCRPDDYGRMINRNRRERVELHVIPEAIAAQIRRMPLLHDGDLEFLTHSMRRMLFEKRELCRLEEVKKGVLLAFWRAGSAPLFYQNLDRPVYTASLRRNVFAFAVHQTLHEVYGTIIINSTSKWGAWLLKLGSVARSGSEAISHRQFVTMFELLLTPASHQGLKADQLERYVRRLRGLPSELEPPSEPLSEELFQLEGHRWPSAS